jgi:hypothetical protein
MLNLGGDPSAVAPLMTVVRCVVLPEGSLNQTGGKTKSGVVKLTPRCAQVRRTSAYPPKVSEGFIQVFGPNCCRGLLGERQSSDLGRC